MNFTTNREREKEKDLIKESSILSQGPDFLVSWMFCLFDAKMILQSESERGGPYMYMIIEGCL